MQSILFIARRASLQVARRTPRQSLALPSPPQLLVGRGYAALTLPVPPTGPAVSVQATQPSTWFQQVADLVRAGIFQMSSTMKKRRAKMNKHKLRKRRKLLRRKSTG